MPIQEPPARTSADGLIDSHCHLADPGLYLDVDAVLRRAREVGVDTILAVGYDVETSRRSIEIAGAIDGVWAAVGVHPNHAHLSDVASWAEIASLAAHDGVVAIGETGLDYYRLTASRETQIRALEWHLALAGSLGKPVILHNREADADLLSILTDWTDAQRRSGWAGPYGVLHCFGGDVTLAERGVALGLVISFAGNVTYRTAENLRQVAAAIPIDSLLLETDAPFLPPVPYRGRRCEPAYLAATARAVADLRGISLDELAAATARNTRRLLRRQRQVAAAARTVTSG